MPKLNETFARRQKFSSDGTTKLWDSEVKGLGLFIGKRTKTWYFQRDVGGKTTRQLIGRYPTISADAARAASLTMALETARGAGRAFQIGAPTLGEALEFYLARDRLRSDYHRHNLRSMFHNHLSDWLKLPLDEIDRRMVVSRHAKLAHTPSLANHLLRAFRTIWNHTRRTCDLSESPTIAIEWHREKAAGGVISDLPEWKCETDQLENPIHTAFYRLLLFTGFRKTEALTLKWQNVHEDRIHLPMTKNGRSFDFPISDRHHDILEPLRSLGREWVFPSPKSAMGHVTGPAKISWSPHSHRRTFATVAVEAGVLEEIVGRLLNHTPQTVTGARYVRPSLDAIRPSMLVAIDALVGRISG